MFPSTLGWKKSGGYLALVCARGGAEEPMRQLLGAVEEAAPPPSPGTAASAGPKARGAYGGDTNMVIILAALLCICLGEFADGEKVRVLPRCNHGFHARCIDTRLASHSSCPTCRHSLLDRAVGGKEEGRSRGNSSDLPGGVAAAVALGKTS